MNNHDPQYILDLLAERRSIREFDGRPVDDTLVDDIIQDGTQAPSSCNHQMWHFVVVKDKAVREKLQKISGSNKHFTTCSAMIILTFHKGWNHNKFAVVQSSAAAAYHMSLSAHVRGLVATWNAGIGNKNKVAALLNIPKEFEIVGALCIGWSNESIEFKKPPRRPLDMIRSREVFDRPHSARYPLKPSKEYQYHHMQNHAHKYSEFRPAAWGWDRIADFRGYAVSAKSPLSGTYISRRFGKEMDVEVGLLPKENVGSVLELMPYGGSYTMKLLRAYSDGVTISLAPLSTFNSSFIVERGHKEGLDTERIDAKVWKDGILPYSDDSFDTVFVPQILESVPDRAKVVDEVWRVLKPGAMAVFTARNMLSWFGLYYQLRAKRQQVPNFGPYVPLISLHVKKYLRSRFRIIEDGGISLSPKKAGVIEKGWKKWFCRLYTVTVMKEG